MTSPENPLALIPRANNLFLMKMILWLSALLHTALLLTTVRSESDDPTQRLLQSNKEWSSDVDAANATFFSSLAQGQNPKILWIGCSDSRVPESVITRSLPGDMFVERNIANQIPPTDANSMAVLEYTIDHLSVEHVIVVGHVKCGGATASLQAVQSGYDPTQTIPDTPPSDLLNKWLAPLTKLGFSLKHELLSKPNDEALQFLIEENVKRQVENVCNTEVIKNAWELEVEGKGRKVRVHGWIYDISTGLLRDLGITRGPPGH